MSKVKRLKYRMDNFSARGDICPICQKDFRHGCGHSVKEAKDKLFEKYLKATIKKEINDAEKRRNRT